MYQWQHGYWQSPQASPNMSYNTGKNRLFGHDKADIHKGVNRDRKSLSSRYGFVQMAGTCPMGNHTVSSFRDNCIAAGEADIPKCHHPLPPFRKKIPW
jgi:hypothetical protein